VTSVESVDASMIGVWSISLGAIPAMP